MAEPEVQSATPKSVPPPSAPAFAELFEQSIAAIIDPSVFVRAAARPAPSFGAAAGLALAAGAAALAVNLAHAAIESPDRLRQLSPAIMAAVGAGALGLYALALLLFAGAIYALGNAFGGKGDFERGLQAAAMLSVLAPLQMLCNWFPLAWIAPALLAAWAASGALAGLFNARPGPARALCALLAAGAIGLQAAGRALADRAQEAYAAAQVMKESPIANADLARSITALARQAQAATAQAGLPAAGSPLPASGLDLLRGDGTISAPSPDQPSAPDGGPAPIAAATAQAMQANAAGMLDALTPLLNSLTSSKAANPQQKADIK
jgi:Yip1-like protein